MGEENTLFDLLWAGMVGRGLSFIPLVLGSGAFFVANPERTESGVGYASVKYR